MRDPYSKVPAEKLILRDYLAAERTVLANERTLLAFIRTALAILLSGVTLIKFFDSLVLEVVGWVLIPLGILILLIGFIRHSHMSKAIKQAEKSGLGLKLE